MVSVCRKLFCVYDCLPVAMCPFPSLYSSAGVNVADVILNNNLSDVHNYSGVSAKLISNALKRKRQCDLEELGSESLNVGVILDYQLSEPHTSNSQ